MYYVIYIFCIASTKLLLLEKFFVLIPLVWMRFSFLCRWCLAVSQEIKKKKKNKKKSKSELKTYCCCETFFNERNIKIKGDTSPPLAHLFSFSASNNMNAFRAAFCLWSNINFFSVPPFVFVFLWGGLMTLFFLARQHLLFFNEKLN